MAAMAFQKLFDKLQTITYQMLSDAMSMDVLELKTRQIVEGSEQDLFNEYQKCKEDYEDDLVTFIGDNNLVHNVGAELLDLWVPALTHATAYHTSWERLGDLDIKFQEEIAQYYHDKYYQQFDNQLAAN